MNDTMVKLDELWNEIAEDTIEDEEIYFLDEEDIEFVHDAEL
jgi:hypothetical protein